MKGLRLLFSKHLTKVLLIGSILLLMACDMTDSNMDLTETQKRMNEVEGCFSCQFFRVVFNAGSNLAVSVYPRVCDISLSLLAIGFCAWLLWHVLQLLTTMREPNLAQFWIQLFQTLFKSMFVAILIASKERLIWLIHTILEPIAMIFINLSAMMLRDNWVSSNSEFTYDVSASSFSNGPGFPNEIGKRLADLIYRITVTLNVGRVLGLRLMLGSDFANFWLGLTTVVIFFLMTLFFPFYLIDGILRIAFVLVLLPLFLAGWAFKKTSHYLTKAWAIFLGSFLQIMVACVFVAICIATLEGFMSIRGYSHLLTGAAQDVSKDLYAGADRMSYSFLSFLLIAFYMYSLSKRITSVTAHLTGAPASSILAGAIERIKSAVKATVFAAIAIAAYSAGLAPVAEVAKEKAKSNIKDAAKQKGGS